MVNRHLASSRTPYEFKAILNSQASPEDTEKPANLETARMAFRANSLKFECAMKKRLWLIFLIASVTLGCLVLAQRREIKRQKQLIEELQLQVENGFGAETNHAKRIP